MLICLIAHFKAKTQLSDQSFQQTKYMSKRNRVAKHCHKKQYRVEPSLQCLLLLLLLLLEQLIDALTDGLDGAGSACDSCSLGQQQPLPSAKGLLPGGISVEFCIAIPEIERDAK